MPDRKYSFEVNRTSTAPPEVLFRIATDGANWSKWAGPTIVQSSWERQGDPAPAGIGAIRRLGMWPVVMREETIEYEQDRRHVYAFADNRGPAKDYRAEITLTPNAAGGTDLKWTGAFSDGPIPGSGPVVLAVMRNTIRGVATRLVKTAEAESAGASSQR